MRRVAISQRDRPDAGRNAVVADLHDPDGVAADADVLRLVEGAAFPPDGAAEVPAPAGNFLAIEDVDTQGHAPLVADRAAPEDAALQAVAAVSARHPRDGARLEAVQVLPQHDIDRAAHGVAAESAQALAAQKLDALDRRERQGIQIAGGRGVRPAIDQDQQRLPSGEEVADDAGIQQLLESLGAGPLQKIPVALRDDARDGREVAGLGRARRHHGQDGKRSQYGLQRTPPSVSSCAG